MAHLSTSRNRAIKPTPEEWLTLGAQFGQQANKWARRGDLVAHVGPQACVMTSEPDAEPIAAALFKPELAEIEINTEMALEGVLPEHVGDFTKRSTQFDHPVTAGAVLHEAMHARHTRFDLAALQREVRKSKEPYVGDLVMWFEESRIELRGVRHFPGNRSFLRASALQLAMREIPDADQLAAAGSLGMSQMLLLTSARVDAGVLDVEDAEGVESIVRSLLGDELVDKLRQIWYRAQRLNCDKDYQPLMKLAREWLKLLEDAGHAPPPPAKMVMISLAGDPGDDSDGGDSDGDGEGSMSAEDAEALRKALEEAAEDAEIGAQSDAYDQKQAEADEEAAKQRAAAAKEQQDHKDEASKVFAKSTTPMPTQATNSRLTRSRQPSPRERAAAVELAKLLDRARYRDRVVVQSRSIAPPGRLRSGAAVQSAAYRAAGRPEAVDMWKRKRRVHTEDPNLTVGIMCDISGSMNAAMEPIAVTSWIVQEAGRRIQANCATVYYGNEAFPVLKPGQHLDEVKVYTAPDGTEKFESAFKAIDGALGLLTGVGARLLVIVSDCCYTGHEGAALDRYVSRCLQAGVGVVIYNPEDRDHYIRSHLPKPVPANVEILARAGMSPVDLARHVGQAAVKSLERMGGRS